MASIPPQVVGLVTNMAIGIGRAKLADRKREHEVTGAVIDGAIVAIEECGNLYPPSSPVWIEVTEKLSTSESALEIIDRLARQQPLGVSSEAEPYLKRFAQMFIAEALDGASLDTTAILTAIGLLRQHLAPTPVMDPLASIPWNRRPGAPQFRISPGMDGPRFLTHLELVGGNEPGDVRLSWSVNDGPEVFPLLMPQPGQRGWVRQAKPADCDWGQPEPYTAHLRLRFVTPEGEHGYHYFFPLERHPKGHWILQSHLGTGVHDPEVF